MIGYAAFGPAESIDNGPLLSPLAPLSHAAGLPEAGDFASRLGEPKRQVEKDPVSTASERRKIWEFATYLHCSIIGTCLPTAELKRILLKLGRADAMTASEHDLHASAITIAAQRQEGAESCCIRRSIADTGSRSINSIRQKLRKRCAQPGRMRCSAVRFPGLIGRR